MSRPIKLVSGAAKPAPAPFAVEPAAHAPKGAAMRELAYNEIKR
ncbi:MAG: GntR family transcriptional regulator, partial [Ralstonia pickettii]|nr:GntR family transcriptional regulator [Ralstonia pickettii]